MCPEKKAGRNRRDSLPRMQSKFLSGAGSQTSPFSHEKRKDKVKNVSFHSALHRPRWQDKFPQLPKLPLQQAGVPASMLEETTTSKFLEGVATGTATNPSGTHG